MFFWKNKLIFILEILLLLLTADVFAQGVGRSMYVNVAEENLRFAPGGKKLGALQQGAEVVVLSEQDSWVKVQVTAWIWKPSLTNVKSGAFKGEYHALHILVKTKEEAEAILKDLKAGKKDFKAVAKEKSLSPSAKLGGDLGYFNKGDFDSSIENAIVNLKVNEMSGVIQSAYGFNIFKRIE